MQRTCRHCVPCLSIKRLDYGPLYCLGYFSSALPLPENSLSLGGSQRDIRQAMGPDADVDASAEASNTVHKWERTAHGKGRVRPRKNQPPSAQAGVLRLTAVAHA